MLHHLHPEHHDSTVIKGACITCRDVHYAHPAKETGGRDMGGQTASWWRKFWIMKIRISKPIPGQKIFFPIICESVHFSSP